MKILLPFTRPQVVPNLTEFQQLLIPTNFHGIFLSYTMEVINCLVIHILQNIFFMFNRKKELKQVWNNFRISLMSKLSLTTSLSNIQTLEAFNISNLKHLFWAILVKFCEPSTEIMQMYKLSEPRLATSCTLHKHLYLFKL